MEKRYKTEQPASGGSKSGAESYIGSQVLIKKSDKYPSRVGSEATIIDIPVHPNTWYRVEFADGGQLRLRQSSFKIVEQQAQKLTDVDEEEPSDTSQKSSGNKTQFRIGVRVRIRETANVRHRVSHLISSCGVITSVPTHPNTWYEVEMDDKSKGLVKFQATALILENEEEDYFEDNDKHGDPPVVVSKHLLSDTDPLLWVGQNVVLKCGPMLGETAVVKKSGNGWVQLKVDRTGQDVARRAYELLVPEDSPLIDASGKPVVATSTTKPQRDVDDEDDDEEEEEEANSIVSGLRPSSRRESKRVTSSSSASEGSLVGREIVITNGVHTNCLGVIESGNGYWYIRILETNEKVRKKREQFNVLADVNELFQNLVPDGDDEVYETFKDVEFKENNKVMQGKIEKYCANHFKIMLENEKSVLRWRDEVTIFNAPVDIAKLMMGKRQVETKNNDDSSITTNTRSVRDPKEPKRLPRSSGRSKPVVKHTKSTRSKNLPVSDDPSVHQLLEANRMRTEGIASWMDSHRQKLMQYNQHRPNLKLWLDRILGDEELEDKYVPPLAKVHTCLICKLEKEQDSDHCWNPACWKSPIFESGAVPLDESRDALPSANSRSGSDYVFAVAQSPRKPGFIEVSEASFPFFFNVDSLEVKDNNAVMKGWGRFVAGRKRMEGDAVFSPLETFRLQALPYPVGSQKRPRLEPRHNGLDGYFGRGWNDELSRPFLYKRDHEHSDEDDEDDCVTDLSGLDYRWRSWNRSSVDHPDEDVAKLIMEVSTAIVDSETLVNLESQKELIYALAEKDEAKRLKLKSNSISSKSGKRPSKQKKKSATTSPPPMFMFNGVPQFPPGAWGGLENNPETQLAIEHIRQQISQFSPDGPPMIDQSSMTPQQLLQTQQLMLQLYMQHVRLQQNHFNN